MRGATGTGDDDLDSAARGFPGVVEHPLRRAVRRDDTDLEADTELGQSFGGSSMVGQSESLPMIRPTCALSLTVYIPSVGPNCIRKPMCCALGAFPNCGNVIRIVDGSGAAHDVDVTDLAILALTLAVQVDLRVRHPREQVMDALVHRHLGSFRRTENVGHHGDRRDRRRISERVVENRAQVLLELRGAGASIVQ